MALAIFDLDNTLIAGDSDHAWGQFLVDNGLVDADHYKAQNDKFYADYLSGSLDINEYVAFSLSVLKDYPKEKLHKARREFIDLIINPLMLPKARNLINSHKANGDTILIITATNRFVTGPIAEAFGVENLIAIEVEEDEEGYTGKSFVVPSFHEGKITRLEQWLETNPHSMEGSFFYSDSHNDLPLLKKVSHPVAVDPDDTLKQFAEENSWQIISLR